MRKDLLEDIIKYFESKKEEYLFLYQQKHREKSDFTNHMILFCNLLFAGSSLLIALWASYFPSFLSFYSSLLTQSINSLETMVSVEPTNVSTLLFNASATTFRGAAEGIMTLVETSRNFAKITSLPFGLVLLLMAISIWREKSINKKIEKIQNTIICLDLIQSYLYELKMLWTKKIQQPEIKNELLRFASVTTEEYATILAGIIARLRQAEKQQRG